MAFPLCEAPLSFAKVGCCGASHNGHYGMFGAEGGRGVNQLLCLIDPRRRHHIPFRLAKSVREKEREGADAGEGPAVVGGRRDAPTRRRRVRTNAPGRVGNASGLSQGHPLPERLRIGPLRKRVRTQRDKPTGELKGTKRAIGGQRSGTGKSGASSLAGNASLRGLDECGSLHQRSRQRGVERTLCCGLLGWSDHAGEGGVLGRSDAFACVLEDCTRKIFGGWMGKGVDCRRVALFVGGGLAAV